MGVTILAVPTLIIASRALQARTDAINALLQRKPDGVRWAVLTQPRLQPIEPVWPQVIIRTAPPGCACCVGNVPFRVALTRLMRGERPDALIVELGALDHLDQVRDMFADPWFSQAIRLVGAVTEEQPLDVLTVLVQLSAPTS